MFSPKWTAPFPEFVEFCSHKRGDELDFRPELSSSEVLRQARRALEVLYARGNEGPGRESLFATGGEPEYSRVQLYNACRILNARHDERLRILLEDFVT